MSHAYFEYFVDYFVIGLFRVYQGYITKIDRYAYSCSHVSVVSPLKILHQIFLYKSICYDNLFSPLYFLNKAHSK